MLKTQSVCPSKSGYIESLTYFNVVLTNLAFFRKQLVISTLVKLASVKSVESNRPFLIIAPLMEILFKFSPENVC